MFEMTDGPAGHPFQQVMVTSEDPGDGSDYHEGGRDVHYQAVSRHAMMGVDRSGGIISGNYDMYTHVTTTSYATTMSVDDVVGAQLEDDVPAGNVSTHLTVEMNMMKLAPLRRHKSAHNMTGILSPWNNEGWSSGGNGNDPSPSPRGPSGHCHPLQVAATGARSQSLPFINRLQGKHDQQQEQQDAGNTSLDHHHRRSSLQHQHVSGSHAFLARSSTGATQGESGDAANVHGDTQASTRNMIGKTTPPTPRRKSQPHPRPPWAATSKPNAKASPKSRRRTFPATVAQAQASGSGGEQIRRSLELTLNSPAMGAIFQRRQNSLERRVIDYQATRPTPAPSPTLGIRQSFVDAKSSNDDGTVKVPNALKKGKPVEGGEKKCKYITPDKPASIRKKKEMRHICPAKGCGKAFSQLSALNSHMKVHTTERPFVCFIGDCGATFKRKSDVKRHMRTIHKVNDFSGYPAGLLIYESSAVTDETPDSQDSTTMDSANATDSQDSTTIDVGKGSTNDQESTMMDVDKGTNDEDSAMMEVAKDLNAQDSPTMIDVVNTLLGLSTMTPPA